MSTWEIEEGQELRLDFEKLQKVARSGQAVIPAVAQDVVSGEVLLVGYVNEEALRCARETGNATFWSTSRDELWVKGATSGDLLKIEEIRVNCEQNSLLYRVRLVGGGACHTKGADKRSRRNCYYRRIGADEGLEHDSMASNLTDLT